MQYIEIIQFAEQQKNNKIERKYVNERLRELGIPESLLRNVTGYVYKTNVSTDKILELLTRNIYYKDYKKLLAESNKKSYDASDQWQKIKDYVQMIILLCLFLLIFGVVINKSADGVKPTQLDDYYPADPYRFAP